MRKRGWRTLYVEETKFRGPPKFWIHTPGMRTFSMETVTVDGQFLLIDCEPEPQLAIVRQVGVKGPSMEQAAFFAHCIAYEHEVPAGLSMLRAPRLWSPLYGKLDRVRYDEEVQTISDSVHYLRMGHGSLHFRRPAKNLGLDPFDLPLTQRYANAVEAVRIYSTALRQADPLSEYLHYYRVLEGADLSSGGNGNGLRWLGAHLSRIRGHNFGRLYFEPGGTIRGPRRKPFNVFSRLRRRALERLAALGPRPGGQSVPEYLYGAVRCGIAHGKRGILTFDFGPTLARVSRDLAIVKLLARIAIDDSILSPVRRKQSDDGAPLLDFERARAKRKNAAERR